MGINVEDYMLGIELYVVIFKFIMLWLFRYLMWYFFLYCCNVNISKSSNY